MTWWIVKGPPENWKVSFEREKTEIVSTLRFIE